jgi:VanZ family protein
VTGPPGRAAGAGAGSGRIAFLLYWLPALAYIALIFTGSSIRGENLPHGIPNLDKVAHLLEYSLLGLLLGRAIRFTLAGWGRIAAVVVTIALGALIGAADELYQRSVSGRSSDIRDWLVDVLAVTVAVLLAQWISVRSLRRRAERSTEERAG